VFKRSENQDFLTHTMFKAIRDCLWGLNDDESSTSTVQHPWGKAEKSPDSHDALLAHEIINAMLHAEKTGEELRLQVSNVVEVMNWTESLARAVLAGLDEAVKNNSIIKEGPLKEALNKAVAAAVGFAKEHPIWTTLIALGILVELLPWVVEALGFAARGPVAGK
jgi:hypothetical protein